MPLCVQGYMDKVELFKKVNDLFLEMALGDKNNSENEIKPLLRTIINDFHSCDFEEMTNIRSGLFVLGSKYDTTFFILLYIMFQTQFNEIKNIEIRALQELQKNELDDHHLNSKLLEIYETSLSGHKQIRLNDFDPTIDLSQEEASSLLIHLTDLFRYTTSKFMLDFSDINMLVVWAGIGRKLSQIINSIDYFYVLLENIIDRLTTSQRFQLARDFAEEALTLSFKDSNCHWGYFIQFKVFNGQFIARETIIYLNACLTSIVSQKSISKTFYETFLINIYRFYRNYGFVDSALEFYGFILAETQMSSYHKESLTNSHFHLLVLIKNESVVLSIYEYLNNHRESIIESGEHAVLPWLNLIYISRSQFPSHPDIKLLDQYLPLFESITNKSVAKRLRILANGDSPELKNYLIESLLSHYETRDSDDFAGEIRNTLVIANNLIEYSFKRKDITAFLLAMILKSDHTYVFKEHENIKTLQEAADLTHDEIIYNQFYKYANFIQEKLVLPMNGQMVWFALAKGNIYQLTFRNNTFSEISILNEFTQEALNDWLANGYKLLSFDETIVKGGQIQQYFQEYQQDDLNAITNKLFFMSSSFRNEGDMFLIMDMELGNFPHNLLINSEGELSQKYFPITNVLSTEWYIDNVKKININNRYTSSLWIPIAEGDMVLNLLFSRLEKVISEYQINLITESIPQTPLNSDISILIAHGDKGISSFPFLFPNDKLAITNINKIIRESKILILFVCYSGSSKKSIIRQKINSMVRVLLKSNIKTVIAPFWSLHISIPPVWLPTFIDTLEAGESVSKAVYIANKKVFEQNLNPGAWCCMHTFGNPFVFVDKINA